MAIIIMLLVVYSTEKGDQEGWKDVVIINHVLLHQSVDLTPSMFRSIPFLISRII